MGGGTVWRGMARLVSPAVRVASSSGPSSCSFCKVGGSVGHQGGRAARATRVRSCGCTSTSPKAAAAAAAASSSNLSQQAGALWEPEEWEFAEEEERVDHLVFGSLPSRAEIEEATSELQNALRLGLVAQAGDPAASWSFLPGMIGEKGASSEGSLAVEKDDEETPNPKQMVSEIAAKQFSEPRFATRNGFDWIEPPRQDGGQSSMPQLSAQNALDWIEPPPVRSLQTTGKKNSVADAFRQFQHNPEVQNMVVSLATDPAVWNAVLANEKILEFRRKLQTDKEFMEEEDAEAEFKDEPKAMDEPNVFARWRSFWFSKFSLFVDVLSHIVNGLFKAAERPFFAEEDGDFVDRTVKSCAMLAVIVLSVVILKRLAVQSA